MKVSIVIPCFNQAAFVDEAVRSACRQSWASTEVIVVDDGSTDGSGEIASKHPGVTVIRQRNGGVASARNAGFATSRGDVIIFLDADDRLRVHAARHAVEALTAHPTAAMVFGRCQLIDEAGSELPTNLPEVRQAFYLELLRRNYIWMPAMAAFRRSALELVGGFDSTINPSADYEMYLRVARQLPMAAHDAVVADYRRYGASMSSDPVLMLEHTLTVMRRQEEFVHLHPLLQPAWWAGLQHWRQFYGEQLVDRFRVSLHAGRIGDTIREAMLLLRYYPAGVRQHLGKKARLVAAHLVALRAGA
jgi:glycosyltransferase involved in cell wall biosynthesis